MISKAFRRWAFAWHNVQQNIREGSGLYLDLGCGEGGNRVWVEGAGWICVGLDVDVSRGER